MEQPGALPQEFCELFLRSSLTELREKGRPVYVRSTMRRMLTAAAVR